eukprot:TRINITY_DN812_c0_g1_i2.p1 TRINITY_DN812_c0_g1~~TRINITY_DN812_c0_g1_i2.p1  ORF type:complete len:155 (+),score=36.95 TRINITY_DN812_c0_g1_i2:50-466(+)
MAMCSLPDAVVTEFKKFKLAKDPANTGFILKVNKKDMIIELDETLTNVTVEEIAEQLPEAAPRYIIYSYKQARDDGRVSYPIVFIFYCPRGISPELAMLASSSKTNITNRLDISKSFDLQEAETLTTDWLKEKLAFFK